MILVDTLEFLTENWDTISLLITNVIAYFMKSPIKQKNKEVF